MSDQPEMNVLTASPVGSEPANETTSELAQLWLARAVQLPEVKSRLFRNKPLQEAESRCADSIKDALGIENEVMSAEDLEQIRTKLEIRSDLESGTLSGNIRMLGRRIGLSPLEQRILNFRVQFRLHSALQSVMEELLSGWNDITTHQRLAAILGTSIPAIANALAPSGVLCKSRLMCVSETLEDKFSEKIALPSGLINTMITPHRTVASLMSFFVAPAIPGKLTIKGYPHLAEEIALAQRYLEKASRSKRKGVNVLLHGIPGTGKTELAKVICNASGLTLYDIQGKRRADAYYTGMGRLSALLTAQRALHRTRQSAILFDEIDGIFEQSIDEDQSPLQLKQFINEFMEEVAVPTFWIANRPEKLDPAFLRRFDIIIAVNTPPSSIKRKILSEACAGVAISDAWLDRQASVERLTPAMITRIADVARMTSDNEEKKFTASFGLLLNQHFRVSGRTHKAESAVELLGYDLSAINVNIDPRELCDRIKDIGTARLLFHGAPGTGKSAYAKALARAIDRPLRPCQASDLLAPYVGETESNIRRIFEHARTDEAVLLIDEADSFLQSRDRAVRGWEITQVNEFLTQLEYFDGVVICTTNFIDSLDPAAMRRFDVKVEFKALAIEQRVKMFEQLCCRFDIRDGLDSIEIRTGLGRLETLTLGDFAAVARGFRLSKPQRTQDVLASLAAEQHHKPLFKGHRMGFV